MNKRIRKKQKKRLDRIREASALRVKNIVEAMMQPVPFTCDIIFPNAKQTNP